MTGITSYAQNFEDVMLWRALGHIQNGNYIDIGAQDPIIDSVSLAFYERGWHGIHIEPTEHYSTLLRAQRKGDTIIQAAIGNKPGLITLFEIPGGGLSTCDNFVADQHRHRGISVNEVTVPCVTLESIFDMCIDKEIHWLKIDVEGLEKEVLLSWGASTILPWIVIVESTVPLTEIDTHHRWEFILVERGYVPVYFDGLNRFYLSHSHPEIKTAFESPPNVFDEFMLNGSAFASFHKLIDRRYLETIDAINVANDQKILLLETQIKQLNQDIAELDACILERNLKQLQDEQENSNQLNLLKEANSRENCELLLKNAEKLSALTLEHAEHTELLNQKIQQNQQEIDQSRLTQIQCKQDQLEQVGRLQNELSELFREQQNLQNKLVNQLTTDQRRAASDTTELLARQREQDQWIKKQFEQFHVANNDLKDILHGQNIRERDVEEQLLTIRSELRDQKFQLIERLLDQERELLRNQVENQKFLQQQMQLMHVNQFNRDKDLANQLQAMQSERGAEKAQLSERLLNLDRELRLNQAECQHLLQEQMQLMKNNQVNSDRNIAEQFSSMHSLMRSDKTQLMEDVQDHFRELKMNQAENQRFLQKMIDLKNDENTQRQLTQLQSNQEILLRMDAIYREISKSYFKRFIEFTKLHFLKSKFQNDYYKNVDLDKSPVIPVYGVSTESVRNGKREIDNNFKKNDNVNSQPNQITQIAQMKMVGNLATLLQMDGKEFIECAYLTLLRRTSDNDGFNYYYGRLQNGMPKIQILKQLINSAEALTNRQYGKGLRRFIRLYRFKKLPLISIFMDANKIRFNDDLSSSKTMNKNYPAPNVTFSAIESLNGEQFIDKCYQALLLRDPDVPGKSHYLSRLLAGDDKIKIIEAFVNSKEGKDCCVKVDGLSGKIFVHKFKSLPVVSHLISALSLVLYSRTYMQTLHRLVNQSNANNALIATYRATSFEQHAPAFLNAMSSSHIAMRELQRRMLLIEGLHGHQNGRFTQSDNHDHFEERTDKLDYFSDTKMKQIDELISMLVPLRNQIASNSFANRTNARILIDLQRQVKDLHIKSTATYAD